MVSGGLLESGAVGDGCITVCAVEGSGPLVPSSTFITSPFLEALALVLVLDGVGCCCRDLRV